MISNEKIESIQCVVPHDCNRKFSSKSCVYCQIDYTFIAEEPVSLQCNHQICRECMDNVKDLKCKLCNEKIKVVSSENKFIFFNELLIESSLNELFKELRMKFENTLDMYLNVKNNAMLVVERLESHIKNEIDLRVDYLKDQLDKERENLFLELRTKCEHYKNSIGASHEQEDIFLSTNVQLKNLVINDQTMGNFFEKQRIFKDLLETTQENILKEFNISFKVPETALHQEFLGRLNFFHKEISKLKFKKPNRSLNTSINLKENGKIYQTSSHLLASGNSDRTIKLWDFENGYVVNKLNSGTVLCMQFLSKKYLVSAGVDVQIWNILDGTLVCSLIGHIGLVWCIRRITNDLLASGGDDKTINIWSLRSGAVLFTLVGHESSVRDIKLINSSFFASASNDGTIKIWNFSNGTLVNTLNYDSQPIFCLELISSEQLASGDSSGKIKIWDVTNGKLMKQLNDGNLIVYCLCLIKSNIIASAGWDLNVNIWDIEKGVCLFMLLGHNDHIKSMQLLNSSHLATCSDDKTIKIWNINNCALVKSLSSHIGTVNCLQLQP